MVDARQSYGSLHHEPSDRPYSRDLSLLVGLRLLTEDDIPWIFDLTDRKYPSYDKVTTEGWFRNLVLKQPLLFIPQRTDNAFCISMITFTPWYPAAHECTVVFICADDNAQWEAVKLMRASIAWARSRRCVYWRLSSETDADLTMMARRLGVKEISPRYSLRLDQQQ